jgi:hypothetical protein
MTTIKICQIDNLTIAPARTCSGFTWWDTIIAPNIGLKIYKMRAGAMAGVIRLQARQVNVKGITRFDIAMNIPVAFNAASIGSSHQMEIV